MTKMGRGVLHPGHRWFAGGTDGAAAFAAAMSWVWLEPAAAFFEWRGGMAATGPIRSIIVGALPMFGEVEPFALGFLGGAQTHGQLEAIEEHG